MSAQIDSKAPDFTLQNTQGNEVSLSDYKDEKNVVLLFFPLAFTSTCTRELCETRDNMKLYKSMDAVVFGISVDSFFTLERFKKSQNLNFSLLSDFNKEASSKFGVLYDDYFGMKGVSKRAVFVIDKQGIVRHSQVLEDSGELPDFRAVQDTLAKLS